MHATVPVIPQRHDTARLWWHASPAVCAIFYPYLLKGFHSSVNAGMALPALLLALAMAIPLTGFVVAWNLGKLAHPNDAQIAAKRLAWLAVAAPPIYTAAGVLLYMAGDPVADTTLWIGIWIVLAAAGIRSTARKQSSTPAAAQAPAPWLRMSHGISALAILLLFLAMHMTNHLAGLIGEAQHRQLMDIFRTVYRAHLVEPLIVALFLFQVVSGLAMVKAHSTRPADFFRSLQLASGAYLVFFILAHMNSVFFYARRFAGIKTDWDFATGAPAGLIHDAWNIRLVPHYYFGVFLVLSHLVLGARVVALAHGARREMADRWSAVGIAASALAALLIMLGMCGVHLPI